MTMAAGVIAVMAEQSDSAAGAAAADKYRTMFAETCFDPFNAEPLSVAVAAHDLEPGSGQPQIGEVGVFEADVEFIDLAVVTRDDLAQIVDIDCRH